MISMSSSCGDAYLSTWGYDDEGWDTTSYDDSYHNRYFQPCPYNTPASYPLHTSAYRHHHYSPPPRRPQYMPPSPPPQYVPPPQHYQQPRAWTSEPPNQPHSMDALLSMLRSMEARLDDIEQRWSRAQSPPRPEPDPPYGMTHAWQSPSWNPGPITPKAVAAIEDQVIDASPSFSCEAERVFAGDDASPSRDASSTEITGMDVVSASTTSCLNSSAAETSLDRQLGMTTDDTQIAIAEAGSRVFKLEKETLNLKNNIAEVERHVLDLEKDSLNLKNDLGEVESCALDLEKKAVDLKTELAEVGSSDLDLQNDKAEIMSYILILERQKQDIVGEKNVLIFDPGGDISPRFSLCVTSPRCSWFVATWYPP